GPGAPRRAPPARLVAAGGACDRGGREPVPAGPEVLAVDAVDALGDRGLPALRRVTLTVRGGEIVGVAGVAGNGQRELGEVIAGLRSPSAGRVRINGRDRTGASPLDVRRCGV